MPNWFVEDILLFFGVCVYLTFKPGFICFGHLDVEELMKDVEQTERRQIHK